MIPNLYVRSSNLQIGRFCAWSFFLKENSWQWILNLMMTYDLKSTKVDSKSKKIKLAKHLQNKKSHNHTYQGHRRWQLPEMLLAALLKRKWNTLPKEEVDFECPRRKRKQNSKINVKTWSWLPTTFYYIWQIHNIILQWRLCQTYIR